MSLDRTVTIAEGIERLHTSRHAWVMYGLIRSLCPHSVVEVGAWHGFCTLHLAQALEDNGAGVVTVIDNFSLQNDAVAIHNNLNRAKLGHRLNIINGKSSEVQWPAQVDFAFIDGDHSLQGCLDDCNKAIQRGAVCVCIHDTVGWWGPRDYVEMFRKESAGQWDVMEFGYDSGFTVLLKQFPKPPVFYSEKDYPEGHV